MLHRLKYHLQFVSNRSIIIYGTGKDAKKCYEEIHNLCEVSCFTSQDYNKINAFCGLPVVSPDELTKSFNKYVIIATSKYHEQINQQLQLIGYKEKKDFFDYYAPRLPYDYVCGDSKIGRYADFGYGEYQISRWVKSIGSFSSISYTNRISEDHPLSGVTVYNLENFLPKDIIDTLSIEQKHNKIQFGHDIWIGDNTFINASRVKKNW